MKKTTIFFLSVTISLAIMAQSGDELFVNPKIDDLRHQLLTTGNDSLRASLMVQLAESFMYTNMDSNLYYSEAALKLTEQTDFIQEQIGAMGFKAQGLINIGNLPKAMEISLKAVELGKHLPARFGSIGPNYDNLGQIYFLIGEYDQAIKYWRQELAIGGEDLMGDAFGNWNIANIYEERNQLDSSLIYLDRSFETFGRIHYSWYPDVYHVFPHWYNTRAKILTKQGKTALALQDFHQSLNMSLKNNELVLSSVTCNDLSNFFDSRGQPDSSIYYAEKALEFARRSSFKKGILDAASLLSKLYEPTNPAKALQYLKIKEEQQNSLFGAGNMEAIREMMIQEEVRQKELAAAQKAYQDRLRQYALLGFLGTALLVAFFLYRNNRQNKKNNARLQAQNRELEIEAALERVRARTMAMHKSDELAAVTNDLYQQLATLGIKPYRCNIAFVNEQSNAAEFWSTTNEGKVIPNSASFSLHDHKLIESMYATWKRKDQTVIRIEGKDRVEWTRYIMRYVDFEEYREQNIDLKRLETEPAVFTVFPFRQGFFFIHTTTELINADQEIIARFAKVFEQTYTRFLDLQKAEDQAREAQLEATLEKLRSTSLAMHSSKELAKVVQEVFERIKQLINHVDAVSINVFRKGTKDVGLWTVTPEQSYPIEILVPYFKHPQFDISYTAKEQGKTLATIALNREEKNALYRHFLENTAFGKLINEERLEKVLTASAMETMVGIGKHSAISVISFSRHQYKDEEKLVIQRFAKVFDQTYTRFLDLEKAEAFARETARQAALDRVRAEIASMRTAEDLERIPPLIWKELITLEVPFFRCGVFIVNEEVHLCRVFLTTPEGESLAALELPFDSSDLVQMTVQHWQAHTVYTREWSKAEFLQWMQSLIEQGYVDDPKTYQGNEEAPEHLALHFVPFTQGMLYVGSEEALTGAQLSLVQALADAFSVAYARYEDFNHLEKAKVNLEQTLTDLRATQSQLIQQEKLASLGQLTAGIAHEIKNPLNFVNNFSEVSQELLEEMQAEIDREDWAEVKTIAADLRQNLQKIHQHGARADGIVQSMLLHARGGSGIAEPTDLNAFVREYVNLAFHGMRAGKDPIPVKIDLELDESLGKIPLVVEDFSRVILNLCSNAFDAMRSKLHQDLDYQPRLSVRTHHNAQGFQIEISDNGPGIPAAIRDKVLQPFFTTKKGTEGTGLGLSISNDIVKAHGGELVVETKEGEGTKFIVLLPGK